MLCACLCLLLLTGCHQEKTEKVSLQEDTISYQDIDFSQFHCGDIINLQNIRYLSNLAIPGKWKHSLIYLGSLTQVQEVIQEDYPYYQKIVEHFHTGEEKLVLDANSTGVKIRKFEDMANLKKESYLKALTCYRLKKDNDFIQSFIEKAMDYYNTPYDFEMNSQDDYALYCSELIYRALQKNNIELHSVSQVFNYDVITPTDLINELQEKNLVEQIMILEK